MCDTGRDMYQHLSIENRQRFAFVTDLGKKKRVEVSEGIDAIARKLKAAKPDEIALVLSAQYTCEEYDAILSFFVGQLKVKKVFQWREPTEDIGAFDGILLRGDRNANTAGLLSALKKHGISSDKPKNQLDELAKSGAKFVVALVPEVPSSFPSLNSQIKALTELEFVSFWTVNGELDSLPGVKHVLPLRGFAEKKGTFINSAGKEGVLTTPFKCPVEGAMCVKDTTKKLAEAFAHR
jgi:NADH-quinone oxidoreductase subunit G